MSLSHTGGAAEAGLGRAKRLVRSILFMIGGNADGAAATGSGRTGGGVGGSGIGTGASAELRGIEIERPPPANRPTGLKAEADGAGAGNAAPTSCSLDDAGAGVAGTTCWSSTIFSARVSYDFFSTLLSHAWTSAAQDVINAAMDAIRVAACLIRPSGGLAVSSGMAF